MAKGPLAGRRRRPSASEGRGGGPSKKEKATEEWPSDVSSTSVACFVVCGVMSTIYLDARSVDGTLQERRQTSVS